MWPWQRGHVKSDRKGDDLERLETAIPRQQIEAAVVVNNDGGNEQKTSGNVVLGGTTRAMIILLAKKWTFKSMLRKRAFMTIGGTAESSDVAHSLSRRSPNAAFSRSRPVMYVEATLLAMMVFGTYDVCIHFWNELKRTNRLKTVNGQVMDIIARIPDVVVHTAAGAASGVARSLFWMGWEATINRNNWIRDHPKFCVRSTVHHSIGYGTLFGVYQATRQSLLIVDPMSILVSLLPYDSTRRNEENVDEQPWVIASEYYTSVKPKLYTFLAGGFAGQAHHIVQHYTSHWKQFHSKVPPLPRLYPTLTSFGTMALCFMAFEHGSEVIDGWTGELADFLEKIMGPP